MNERIKQYRTRLTAWWTTLAPLQRWRMAGLAVFGATILVVGLGFFLRQNWQPLYTNLNAKTAGAITGQLSQMKVPYELRNQGQTILVPAKYVDQARISLADKNIPTSGTLGVPAPLTFTLGETSQEIQLTQLQNLEGTLAETIDSISGVHGSQVIINQPPPSLFGETSAAPSGAVFVMLNPGVTLSSGQVAGITNLVARSVSGLSAKNVTVVDQSGQVLSAGTSASSPATQLNGVTGAELSAQSAVDNAIAQNVQTMLNQVLGPGQAVVRVNASLNFAQTSVNSVVYTNKGVLGSQQLKTSASSGTTPVTTQTGAAGNVPIYPTVGAGGTSKSSSSSTINHWLVNTVKTSQSVPAGAINRLTVAVIVNKALTAAQAANLKNVVASAAGVNYARGDQVTVLGQAFNTSQVNAALAAMKSAQQAQTIRQGILAAMALLLAFLTFWWLRRTVKRARSGRPGLVPAGGPDGLGQGPRISVADLLQEMQQKREPTLSDVAREHLDSMLRSDPEGVARMVRSWLQEDDR